MRMSNATFTEIEFGKRAKRRVRSFVAIRAKSNRKLAGDIFHILFILHVIPRFISEWSRGLRLSPALQSCDRSPRRRRSIKAWKRVGTSEPGNKLFVPCFELWYGLFDAIDGLRVVGDELISIDLLIRAN